MRRNAFHVARGEQRNALALAEREGEINRLRASAFDYLSRNGMTPSNANALAGLLDYVPVVGDVSGAEDTYQAARGGDYGTAALMGAATLLGIVPGVGDAASAGVKKGIRAFHGSPHDFDRFDISKIGTGEGAQAYGHGLYFAGNEDVAKVYRDTLSAKHNIGQISDFPDDDAGFAASVAMQEAFGDFNKAREIIASGRRGVERRIRLFGEDARDTAKLASYDSALAMLENARSKGRMYEVNINADPDDFLDWDRPLSEQPKAAQDAMRRTLAQTYGEDFFDEYAAQGTGMKDALDNFDDIPAERWASELGKQGIPGIRYLDAGSRTAGDGSRNYVVFDDSLVEILRKYGLGAVTVGGAYALTQQEYEQAEQLL